MIAIDRHHEEWLISKWKKNHQIIMELTVEMRLTWFEISGKSIGIRVHGQSSWGKWSDAGCCPPVMFVGLKTPSSHHYLRIIDLCKPQLSVHKLGPRSHCFLKWIGLCEERPFLRIPRNYHIFMGGKWRTINQPSSLFWLVIMTVLYQSEESYLKKPLQFQMGWSPTKNTGKPWLLHVTTG